MIKNIPNKYTQKMLLATMDELLRGTYDFFYLPIDFKNRWQLPKPSIAISEALLLYLISLWPAITPSFNSVHFSTLTITCAGCSVAAMQQH